MSLDDRIAMLNTDQRHVFDTIKAHLLHQQCHESDACQCKNFKPLAMFVSGVGGTGKSFLIEAVRALVTSLSLLNDLCHCSTHWSGSLQHW